MTRVQKYMILALVLLTFCVGMCSAGAPALEWVKAFGGSYGDVAQSVQQTADGGYIVAGSTYSLNGDVNGKHNTTVDTDVWVVKLGSSGNLVWQKCLGGTDWEGAQSVQQTADGGYVVAGYTYSNNGDVSGNHGGDNSDFWVVKLDSSGNLVWQKCLGGTGRDSAQSVEQTADGGYVVAGFADSNNGDVSNNHGVTDYWVVKLDSSGNLVWQKSLGGSSGDYAYSVRQTADGGYIVAGESTSSGGDLVGSNHHGSSNDFWVVKLNPAGNMSWNRSYGGSGGDRARSVQQTADGGYIVAGYTDINGGDVSGVHGSADYWVIKLDSAGNLIWQKCLGGTSWNYGYSVSQTADGGYSVAGLTNSNTTGNVGVNHGSFDMWTVKLNTTGGIVWEKCLGGTSDDRAYSIQQTADGGLIVAGESSSNDGDVSGNHGGSDFLVAKFAEAALPRANFTAAPLTGSSPLTVFFNDTSTGSPVAWNWTFGDGKTSTSQNPMNIYLFPGIYTVSLNVTNASGSNTVIKTNYITVGAAAPVADFSANTTGGSPPLTVQFTDGSSNTPTSWNWSFGDGTFSAVQNPVYTYISTGTFTVTLRANNSGGNDTRTRTDYIRVVQPGSPSNTSSMFRANPQHTGVYSSGGTEPTNNLKWVFLTEGVVSSSPTVVNGIVYIGSWDNRIYAVYAYNGTQKWNYMTGGRIDSSPAVVDDVVYFGSEDKKIYALYAYNGTQKWNFTTGRTVGSSPSVADGIVYVGSVDFKTYAIYADNGTQNWNFETTNTGYLSPAVADGIVYIGSNHNNRLFAIYTNNGTQKWSITTGGVASSPAVADGVIYFGTMDNKTCAVFADNGTEKWSFSTGGEVSSSPAVADGVIYIGSRDQKIYALYASNGTWKWSFSTGGPVSSSPAVADGVVYVGSYDNRTYAINITDGTEKWSFSTGDCVLSSPSVADGSVYFGSYDGNIYKIGGITPAPVAGFFTNVTGGISPCAVQFTDTSDFADPISWNWSFGDGTWYNTTNSRLRNPAHVYDGIGNFSVSVSLTITNPSGTSTELKPDYVRVTYGPRPRSAFTANETAGIAPLVVNFTDLSDCLDPVYGEWLIDNTVMYGSIAPYYQNFNWIFWHAGNYSVSLRVTNASGYNTTTKLDYITVYPHPLPVSNFTADVTTGPIPFTVQFNDTSTESPDSWNWSFGDGTFSTEQNASRTYTVPGIYTVNLTATNYGGNATLSKEAYIHVLPNSAPVAQFSANTTTGITNTASHLIIGFIDTSTGFPSSWNWSFGDGSFSTLQNPVHAYTYTSTFTVTLNATNMVGSGITVKNDYITGFLAPPVSEFTFSPTGGRIPLAVQFTDTSYGGVPTSWNWSFGDGTFSTLQDPVHIYTMPGRYIARLTVMNDEGNDTWAHSLPVVVEPTTPPSAEFTADMSETQQASMRVRFTDLSTGMPTSWNWSFGDGTFVDSYLYLTPYVEHYYSTQGLFTVTLNVSNSNGFSVLTKKNFVNSMQAGPNISWQKALGGSEADYGTAIRQTSDGGYILTGLTMSNDSDVSGNHGSQYEWADLWALKLFANNSIAWQKCLGGTGYDIGYSVLQKSDGSYIFAGQTESSDGDVSGYHGGGDAWIISTSQNGAPSWQRSLGGNGTDEARAIGQTSDGGLIMAGSTSSNNGDVSGNHGGRDIWVVRMDAGGTVLWQKCLGGSANEDGADIQQTADGGYILTGSTDSTDGDVTGNHGGGDLWVARLDAGGTVLWQKCLGGSGADTGKSIRQTSDGGYIVAGTTSSTNGDVIAKHDAKDVWVVKLNSTGGIVWKKCLGGREDDEANQIRQTSDGGFIVAGTSRSGVGYYYDGYTGPDGDVWDAPAGKNVWVVKLYPDGVRAWQRSLGGNADDEGYDIMETSDSGFVVTGFTLSNDRDVSGNHGGNDVWAVRLGQPFIAPPSAGFMANVTQGYAPLGVRFTDLSANFPTVWNWDFGDGSNASGQNPFHIYRTSGTYAVNLTVYNVNGTDFIQKGAYIHVGVNADFNRNGRIDIGDVTTLAYMAVGLIPPDLAADFNGNGIVDAGDASKIAWYYVGKIPVL